MPQPCQVRARIRARLPEPVRTVTTAKKRGKSRSVRPVTGGMPGLGKRRQARRQNAAPRSPSDLAGGDNVYEAALQRSRLSVAVVLQIIGVPLVVIPRAPASAQNAPGCTIGMLLLLGLDAGDEVGAGRVGWEGAGELRYVW